MSDVETPPVAAEPTGRQCPRCGASMTEEQEWCLNCGAAVGTRVVAAPGWRAPIVVAAVIAALAAIAVVVAIVQLADDTGQVGETPAAAVQPSPTPPPAVTPTPEASVTPGATVTPEATPSITATPSATPEPTTTPDANGTVAEWPAGKSGWTVVLSSDGSRSVAEDKAAGFTADGISGVGVLKSDDFSSLKAGFWVVFSGQYDSQSAASDALDGIDAKDAYIRRIVPN